jgi:ribosomal protein L39E
MFCDRIGGNIFLKLTRLAKMAQRDPEYPGWMMLKHERIAMISEG